MIDALTAGLTEEIPLAEAAGFFVRMKTATVMPRLVEFDDGMVKAAASNLQRKLAELVSGDMPYGKAGYNKAAPAIDLTEKTADSKSDKRHLDYTLGGALSGAQLGSVAGLIAGGFGRSHRVLPWAGKGALIGSAAGSLRAASAEGGDILEKYEKAERDKKKTASTLGDRLKEIEDREKKKLTRVHRESGALRHGVPGAGAGAALGAGAAALLKKDPRRGAALGAAITGGAGAAFGGIKGHRKGEQVAGNIGKMRRKGIVESVLRRRGARHAFQNQNVDQLQALGYSVRSKAASMGIKLAEGPGGLQQDPQQEGAPAQQMPQPAQQPQQPQQPEQAAAPMMPPNYLNSEVAARQAQQENESGYYRALLEQVQAENQASQAQVQELGAQMQELQQQSQQTGSHIEQATQQAVEAQDRATEHSQQAANMRMGMQKMREQMMQIASQDPDTFAPMQPEPAPMDALNTPMQGQAPQPGAEQSAQAGQPDQAAAPGGGAPPGSTPPQESGGANAPEAKSSGESANPKKDSAKPQVQIKTSAPSRVAMGMSALGGIAGAAEGANMGSQVPQLEQNVEQMSGQTGGFARAMRFAMAKAKLDMARAAQEDPMASALKGGAMGALAGAGLGSQGGRLMKNMKDLRG